jgi:phage terminase large subunit-like protein
MVHARKGKAARAEPVAALYEQGRVVHCGAFPALEEQLMGLGGEGGPSPDRADALVWAVTHLLVDGKPGPRLRVV